MTDDQTIATTDNGFLFMLFATAMLLTLGFAMIANHHPLTAAMAIAAAAGGAAVAVRCRTDEVGTDDYADLARASASDQTTADQTADEMRKGGGALSVATYNRIVLAHLARADARRRAEAIAAISIATTTGIGA